MSPGSWDSWHAGLSVFKPQKAQASQEGLVIFSLCQVLGILWSFQKATHVTFLASRLPSSLGVRDLATCAAQPILCMALGREDCLGTQRPGVSQGQGLMPSSFPTNPTPTTLTTSQVFTPLSHQEEWVRHRWFSNLSLC